MDFRETQKAVHANAKAKGFFEGEKNTGEMLMLIVSEVAEALEADRHNKYCKVMPDEFEQCVEDFEEFEGPFKLYIKDTFEDELADAVIRLMDLAEFKGIDLAWHIQQKMRYNSSRPYKHNKAY